MSDLLVEVSARHVHLSQETVEYFFGEGYELTPKKMLSQPGQYLAEERIDLVGSKRTFENVAILGPARNINQVELSITDCFGLGVKPVLRQSGDIAGSSPIILRVGDKELSLDEGAIVAQRHIHMTTEDAKKYGVEDKQIVSVKIKAERELVFGEVLVRVNDSYGLAMHVDTDEANAAFMRTGNVGEIIK